MLFSGRQGARFPYPARGGRAGRLTRFERAPLLTRTVVWVTIALCLALTLATLGEVWARVGIDQRVQQTQTQNAQLQQDVRSTQQAVINAQSAETVEREARAWGYIRPGDNPVLFATEP